MDYVTPPEPTERKLTNIVTRRIAFPNGGNVSLSIAEWHWEMIAFYDLWNEEYGREQGIVYEWYKTNPHRTDRVFSDVIMLLIRDQYNEWQATLSPGKELIFPAPKKK